MKVALCAAALALIGVMPAWAVQPDGLWLVNHDQPLAPLSQEYSWDGVRLVADEPLYPTLANDNADHSLILTASAGACGNDCGSYGGYDGCSQSDPCCSNGCQAHYGCSKDCGCQDGYCRPGLLDCCRVCPPSGWNADIGFYFLKPNWQTNQAFSVVTLGAALSFQNIDFNYDYSVSPLIALGYTMDNGLGFKVRYWDYRDSGSVAVATGANQIAASASPLGLGAFVFQNTTATANSNLRIQVWDFEITQRLNCNCWVWNFGGGLRYLHTSQAFDVTVNGPVNIPDDLISSHRFKGIGPTLSLAGQRYLGCSGWSLYGNGRASVLVGDKAQFAQLSAANGTLDDNALQSNWGTLPMVELEVGAAYQRRFGNFTLVGSTGLVGQYWVGIGNAANVDTFSAFGTDETMNNTISMTMYGLRASLSLYY